MPTASPTPVRKPPQEQAHPIRRRRPRRRIPWLWVGAVAVVLVAAVIAVVASQGDDQRASAPGLEETRPVEVTGTALPAMSGGTDAAVGAVAPELRGQSFDGTPVAVTHDGRAKVLVFAAHWCPHCQKEIPIVSSHLVQNPVPAGVDVVLVSTGSTPSRPNYPPSKWLDVEGWPTPILVDSQDSVAAQAYGLPAYPYFVAVDATGRVVARTSGEISMAQFDLLVHQALGLGS